MKGILLFTIALISIAFTFLLGTLFSIIYYTVLFWKVRTALKKISSYFGNMALSLDQFGNVNNKQFFNFILIKKSNRKKEVGSEYKDKYINGIVKSIFTVLYDYHSFGDEDDTVSYVIAMNYKRGALNKFGMFWAKFLNFVDKNHLEKARINKYYRDLEAYQRLVKSNFTFEK